MWKRILFMLLSVAAMATHTYASSSATSSILQEVNTYRMQHGLKPLQLNATISNLALKHSKDMASGKVGFGHSGFRSRFHYLLKQFSHVRMVAENVAAVNRNPERAMTIWLHSKPHRKNILGNYQLTGIGIARNKENKYYLTEIFLRAK